MIAERSKRIINLMDFQNAGGPLNLGQLDLTPNADTQYILRMVIKAQHGAYTIPEHID